QKRHVREVARVMGVRIRRQDAGALTRARVAGLQHLLHVLQLDGSFELYCDDRDGHGRRQPTQADVACTPHSGSAWGQRRESYLISMQDSPSLVRSIMYPGGQSSWVGTQIASPSLVR